MARSGDGNAVATRATLEAKFLASDQLSAGRSIRQAEASGKGRDGGYARVTTHPP